MPFWTTKKQKQQEARLKELEQVMDAIAAPMFTTDQNLTITWINDPALQATGYRRDEVVGRMTCAELSKTPLCSTENCTIKTCMRTREPLHGETVLEARDGTKVPIKTACSPLFDEAGNPRGGMEVIIDTTEATRLKEESEAQRQSLREGVEVMSDTMQKVAAGDLTTRVNRDFDGELEQLKGSLNAAVGNLDESLSQVSMSAGQVDSAAGQISSGSQSLATLGRALHPPSSSSSTRSRSVIALLARSIVSLSTHDREAFRMARRPSARGISQRAAIGSL